MPINAFRFGVTGQTVQVGGMDTTNAQTVAASTATTAFAHDQIVEVADISGGGAWIDVGTSPSASADNGAFIPPFGVTRPFILKAGRKVVATAKINVRPLDTDN